MESHLLQMRGLKHSKLDALININEVASFTDALIETLTLIWYISPRLKSHLLQMRGLKLYF